MPPVSLLLILTASLPGPGLRVSAGASPATAAVARGSLMASVVAATDAARPPFAVPVPAVSPRPLASVLPQPAGSDATSPAGARPPSRLPSTAPAARDHAASLVGGVWQCETIAGSTGTHTYTIEDDGSMELQTVVHSGFRTFNIREVYRFDDARSVWTAETVGGTYRGTAAPWTGPKWIFEGTAVNDGQHRSVRMVYFNLGEQAFRRDFQARQDGKWQTYSAETCTRPSS